MLRGARADGIILNRDVARELGIETHGHWAETVAGTFTAGEAIIPTVGIGPLVMHDVAVQALPFTFHPDDDTKVVGLLGFDFIAGSVIKIDYTARSVEALRPEAFVPPPDATELDATFDDHVPVVAAQIGGARGDHFILDTGADTLVIFSGFAAAHPDAVKDTSPDKILTRNFNVVEGDGVGGKLHMSLAQFKDLRVAALHFDTMIGFVLTRDQPGFEGEDHDGLIGALVLRFFDVYLDYQHGRVLLAPGTTTKKTAKPYAPASPASSPPEGARPAVQPTPRAMSDRNASGVPAGKLSRNARTAP